MAEDSLQILQTNILLALRNDPALAALVHATGADCDTRAALKAVTGMTDGEIRLVDEGATFSGLYLYDDDNANADDNDNYIEPTTGTGAWVKYTDVDGSLAWGKEASAGGHVFLGLMDQMHRGRNRGRMPYIEVQVSDLEATEESSSGGTARVTVTVRGYCRAGLNDDGADDLRTLLMRAVKAIRNAKYDTDGDYTLGTGTRLYADSNFDGIEISRARGILWGDVSIRVEFTYTEGVLK